MYDSDDDDEDESTTVDTEIRRCLEHVIGFTEGEWRIPRETDVLQARQLAGLMTYVNLMPVQRHDESQANCVIGNRQVLTDQVAQAEATLLKEMEACRAGKRRVAEARTVLLGLRGRLKRPAIDVITIGSVQRLHRVCMAMLQDQALAAAPPASEAIATALKRTRRLFATSLSAAAPAVYLRPSQTAPAPVSRPPPPTSTTSGKV